MVPARGLGKIAAVRESGLSPKRWGRCRVGARGVLAGSHAISRPCTGDPRRGVVGCHGRLSCRAADDSQVLRCIGYIQTVLSRQVRVWTLPTGSQLCRFPLHNCTASVPWGGLSSRFDLHVDEGTWPSVLYPSSEAASGSIPHRSRPASLFQSAFSCLSATFHFYVGPVSMGWSRGSLLPRIESSLRAEPWKDRNGSSSVRHEEVLL